MGNPEENQVRIRKQQQLGDNLLDVINEHIQMNGLTETEVIGAVEFTKFHVINNTIGKQHG